MKCPGSHFFDLPQQESGPEAAEGTACGELLQMAIESQGIWSSLLTDGTWPEEMPKQASNGVPFDEDMKHFISRMVLPEITRWQHPANIKCETRIDWSVSSTTVVRGQSDVQYVMDYNGEKVLCIDDLKYGWGLVEVKENWQLLGYAIGHMFQRTEHISKVRLRILQPRPYHEDGWCREWWLTPDQLTTYHSQIQTKLTAIENGDRTLATGKHCRYCPASGEACPAFNRTVYEAIETVMGDHYQIQLSDAELSTQLDLLDRVKEVLDIRLRSMKDLAVNRIKNGSILRNWTTVESYSDRKWKPNINPLVIEAMTGVKVVKQEMLSPAQVEKLGVSKDIVNQLVDRHFLGQKIVRKTGEELADKIFGKQKPEYKP